MKKCRFDFWSTTIQLSPKITVAQFSVYGGGGGLTDLLRVDGAHEEQGHRVDQEKEHECGAEISQFLHLRARVHALTKLWIARARSRLP